MIQAGRAWRRHNRQWRLPSTGENTSEQVPSAPVAQGPRQVAGLAALRGYGGNKGGVGPLIAPADAISTGCRTRLDPQAPVWVPEPIHRWRSVRMDQEAGPCSMLIRVAL